MTSEKPSEFHEWYYRVYGYSRGFGLCEGDMRAAWNAARQSPPASHDAGEAVTEALEGIDIAKMESLGWQIALCSVCGMSASAFRPDPRIATLTAEVSRLTGELDAASARLHEVATLCATVEQERDRLTGELERSRQEREGLRDYERLSQIAFTMFDAGFTTGSREKWKEQFTASMTKGGGNA